MHPKDRDIRQRTLRVVAYRLDLRYCPNEIAKSVLLGLDNLYKLTGNERGVGSLVVLARPCCSLRARALGLRSTFLLCTLPLLLLPTPTVVRPTGIRTHDVTRLCLELLSPALAGRSRRCRNLDGFQVGTEGLGALERSTGCNRAPLTLIVNVDSLEMRLLPGNRLARVLVGRGVDDDSDVPKGRVKLAGNKFFALVVVRFETVAGEGCFESQSFVSPPGLIALTLLLCLSANQKASE